MTEISPQKLENTYVLVCQVNHFLNEGEHIAGITLKLKLKGISTMTSSFESVSFAMTYAALLFILQVSQLNLALAHPVASKCGRGPNNGAMLEYLILEDIQEKLCEALFEANYITGIVCCSVRNFILQHKLSWLF